MSRIKEISKSKIGTYLQRVPAASASAGNAMSARSPRKSQNKGVKDFLKRVKGTNMSVDKLTGKAKVPATESFIIPEDIPFKERNAFMGAAAAAHKSGKSHFNFGGKKHPVTMDKKVATKIADDADAMKAFLAKGGKITKLPPGKAAGYHGKDDPGKDMHGMMAKGDTKAMGTRKKVKSMEAVQDVDQMDPEDKKEKLKKKTLKTTKGETATMNPKMGNDKGAEMEQKESLTIRDKLMMVLEGDRSKHYKGAAEAETMDDKYKGDGAKKMKKDHEGPTVDIEKQSHDDASKAGRAGPSMKARPNDKKDGDKKMQTPDDVTKKGGGSSEVKTESTRDQLAGIKAAYMEMMKTD